MPENTNSREEMVFYLRATGSPQVVREFHNVGAGATAAAAQVAAANKTMAASTAAGSLAATKALIQHAGGWRKVAAEVGFFGRVGAGALEGFGRLLTPITWGVEKLFSAIIMGATGAAVAMGAALVGFTTYGLKLAMSRELTETAFETLLGSKALADQVLAQNQAFADYSPWGLEQANGLAQALLIAGINANELNTVMKDVGNAVAAVGGSRDALERVAFNFQEIAGKGQIDSMDIRQFSAARIDALGSIAKYLNMTKEQVKAIQTADGGGADLLKRLGGITGLAKALGGAYPDAMDKLSKTLSGRLSTLKDKLEKGIYMGFKPVLEPIKDILGRAAPMVEIFATKLGKLLGVIVGLLNKVDWRGIYIWVLIAYANGLQVLERNKKMLVRVWHTMIEAAKNIYTIMKDNVVPVMLTLADMVAPALGLAIWGISEALEFAADHAEGLATAFKILLPLMIAGKSLTILKAGTAAGAGLIAKTMPVFAASQGGAAGLMAIAAPFLLKAALIIAAIAAITLGIRWLYKNSETFKKLWDGLYKLLGQFVRLWWLIHKPLVQVALILGKLGFQAAFGFLQGMLEPVVIVVDALATAFGWVADQLEKVVDWIAKIDWPTPPKWVRDFGGWIMPNNADGSQKTGAGNIVSRGARVAGAAGVGAGIGSFILPGAGTAVGGALGGAWGFFSGDSRHGRIPVSMFANSAGFHNAINGRAPGARMVTSGYRTWGLGNANSDHLWGAYDIAGAGLGAYAAAVRNSGGYSEFHGGGGEGRHLHVVPPIGDTRSSVTSGNRGGGFQQYNTINVYPQSEIDAQRLIAATIRQLGRDAIERDPGQQTFVSARATRALV